MGREALQATTLNSLEERWDRNVLEATEAQVRQQAWERAELWNCLSATHQVTDYSQMNYLKSVLCPAWERGMKKTQLRKTLNIFSCVARATLLGSHDARSPWKSFRVFRVILITKAPATSSDLNGLSLCLTKPCWSPGGKDEPYSTCKVLHLVVVLQWCRR